MQRTLSKNDERIKQLTQRLYALNDENAQPFISEIASLNPIVRNLAAQRDIYVAEMVAEEWSTKEEQLFDAGNNIDILLGYVEHQNGCIADEDYKTRTDAIAFLEEHIKKYDGKQVIDLYGEPQDLDAPAGVSKYFPFFCPVGIY